MHRTYTVEFEALLKDRAELLGKGQGGGVVVVCPLLRGDGPPAAFVAGGVIQQANIG